MRELGGNSVIMALWTVFLQLVIIAKQRNFARCVYFFFHLKNHLINLTFIVRLYIARFYASMLDSAYKNKDVHFLLLSGFTYF